MPIDYSVQVSLTTRIILSNDDNQTKIVTTVNTINTLLTSAGSSRISRVLNRILKAGV